MHIDKIITSAANYVDFCSEHSTPEEKALAAELLQELREVKAGRLDFTEIDRDTLVRMLATEVEFED